MNKVTTAKAKTAVVGNFYPRQYRFNAEEKFRAEYQNTLSDNELFAEKMTNNVVRMLSVDVRNRHNAENRTVTWQAEYKNYSVTYSALISNRIIVREVCKLTFPELGSIKTVNGRLAIRINLNAITICRMLAILKQNDITVNQIYLCSPKIAPTGFVKLYRVLKQQELPVKQLTGNLNKEVFIEMKHLRHQQ
jgi:hypothetical protein